MGLSPPAIAFLVASKALGVSFESTLMIGRQSLLADASGVRKAFQEAGSEMDHSTADRIVADGDGYAEPLLTHLGAHCIDSLDASNYEGATIVHDLNEPLPPNMAREYSLVIDSGSLEHVFNFPQALANCLDLVRVGGHFVMITPGNNYLGHGFYQFSPELIYAAVSPSNGYRVLTMLARNDHRWARWYAVADPAQVSDRVELTSPWPTMLYVVAQRTNSDRTPNHTPQQNDYAVTWQLGRGLSVGRAPHRRSRPARAVHAAARIFRGTKSSPNHFKPVSLPRFHRTPGGSQVTKLP